MMSSVKVHLISGFDDPRMGPKQWKKLLVSGDTDTVFLTWHWQRTWWELFGRGALLLAIAKRDNQTVALAPLFSEAGMIFFVGSGGSDYLNFIGDISDPDVLYALLKNTRDQVKEFVGFRFYHVPNQSHTGRYLQEIAHRLDLICFDEGSLPAPALSLKQPGIALANIRKKSMIRAENFFRQNGDLTVQHLNDSASILSNLDEFFDQHIERWAKTPYPSIFGESKQRAFYKQLARIADDSGWLRFTRLDWKGRSIAFHFGFYYRGSFLWYKPSFAIDLAHRSPGQVLLRQLLIAAIDEDAETFDFGLGDEEFKRRFATHINHVSTWGLYPPEVCTDRAELGDET